MLDFHNFCFWSLCSMSKFVNLDDYNILILNFVSFLSCLDSLMDFVTEEKSLFLKLE